MTANPLATAMTKHISGKCLLIPMPPSKLKKSFFTKDSKGNSMLWENLLFQIIRDQNNCQPKQFICFEESIGYLEETKYKPVGWLLSFATNKTRGAMFSKKYSEYPVNAEVPQGSILGPTLFLLYVNDHPDVICNIAIYADDTTLYFKFDQASWLLNLNLIYKTLWTGIKSEDNWYSKQKLVRTVFRRPESNNK